MKKGMRIEVINTGSELLYGQVLNTHLKFLAESLFPLGLSIQKQVTVPDGPAIRFALEDAFKTADLILITGGLGPTSDDLTRDIVAELLNLPLEPRHEIEAYIAERLNRRGIPISDRIMRQALCPKGAQIIHNEFGTAPGIYIPPIPLPTKQPQSSPHLILLPGPPRELRPMVENHVVRLLSETSPRTQRQMKTWRVIGTPESVVEDRIGAQLLELGVELGYCARLGEVDVRIVGSSEQISKSESIILEAFGKAVLPQSAHSLEEYIVNELTKRGQTLATAESCTGGHIANLITNISGSSVIFTHGFVCYANQAKEALGVPSDLIALNGAVSEPVAESLALNTKRVSGASFSLATTGIAGPTGGTDSKPVGTIYIALSTPDGRCIVERHRFHTDRLSFKQLASQAALNLLRRVLIETQINAS
jgi:nicotinamide-nucleotide amidase